MPSPYSNVLDSSMILNGGIDSGDRYYNAIWFRADAARLNGYLCETWEETSSRDIWKVENGVYTLLSSTVDSTNLFIGADIVGSSIRVYDVAGTLRQSATNTVFTNAGITAKVVTNNIESTEGWFRDLTGVTAFGNTADGFLTSTSATWAGCRNGGTLALGGSTGTIVTLFWQLLASVYTLYRAFLYFDTSAIPDTASVIAATLGVYAPNGRSRPVAFFQGTQADALGTTDWNAFTGSEICSRITPATSGFHDLTLNADGLAAISKTGLTKFCIREGYDVDNTAPASLARSTQSFGSGNIPMMAYRPTLKVTWVDGGVFTTKIFVV
jgi:hypothetical protein